VGADGQRLRRRRMKCPKRIITERMADALVAALGDDGRGVDPLVRAAQDQRFGDYQSNCAMGLAKKLGDQPRRIAAQLVGNLRVDDLCEPPEIAGAGFINFKLKADFLAATLGAIPPLSSEREDRLGVEQVAEPEVVVIDMSSPNLAKEMHVGHLRPTIIGDAVARVLQFQGHEVHRINHIGDWGTQFGMLIQYLRETEPRVLEDPEHLQLGDLEEFYVRAKSRFDTDPQFAGQARQAVVDLQSGGAATRGIWKAFCDESLRHCHHIYDQLDIAGLEDRGESFYNDMLPAVVRELKDRGLAVDSEGAVCVFPKGFTNRDDQPLPLIIRKSDGGYMYATTDLAALKQRIEVLGARRIIYVVGNQQKQHFAMLFAVLAETGWAAHGVETIHLPTGMLLNETGAPFKTREGGTVKLKTLLDDAVRRSQAFLRANERDESRRRGYSEAEMDAMAGVIGIAAVKYFELSHNYATDYKFDWDLMLSLDGNTAPYMLYAYARIRSIARRAGTGENAAPGTDPLVIEHPSEVGLAKQLLKFTELVEQLARELKPNLLTEYLYDLSKAFSTFYDRKTGVRVIDAESDALRRSRLRLCELTGRTLKAGLRLLGIETLQRM